MSDVIAKRSLFRVNYYESNQPKSALVVAFTDTEAAAFLGVEGNSGIQVIRDRHPVEVAGVDTNHDLVASSPAIVAPPPPTRNFSDAEIAKLRAMLAKGDFAGALVEAEQN